MQVQGNCDDSIPDNYGDVLSPPLQPLQTGQCVLLLGPDEEATPRVHNVDVREGNNSDVDSLWLDQLYIRSMGSPPRGEILRVARSLWMTNVTLQGEYQHMSEADQDVHMMISTSRILAAGANEIVNECHLSKQRATPIASVVRKKYVAFNIASRTGDCRYQEGLCHSAETMFALPLLDSTLLRALNTNFRADGRCADATFIHRSVHDGGAAHIATSGLPASYRGCTFISEVQRHEDTASDTRASKTAVVESESGTTVRLEDCDFQGTPDGSLLLNLSPQDHPEVFFSDFPRPVTNANKPGTTTKELSLTNEDYLTSDDPMFLALQEVQLLVLILQAIHVIVRHAYIQCMM